MNRLSQKFNIASGNSYAGIFRSPYGYAALSERRTARKIVRMKTTA